MFNLFGRKKPDATSSTSTSNGSGSTANSAQKSLASIRATVERLTKREEFIQKKVEAQTKLALQKKKAGDKHGAIAALKKKKMYEKEIEKLSASRLNLDQQIMAIESASVNLDAVSGMRAGNDALKKVNKELNAEKVEDLRAEVQEGMDEVEEVSNVLSQPLGDPADMADDADLMKELEGMEAEQEGMNLEDELEELESKSKPKTKTKAKVEEVEEDFDFDLPEAPKEDPKFAEKDEEHADLEDDEAAALAELEASLGS